MHPFDIMLYLTAPIRYVLSSFWIFLFIVVGLNIVKFIPKGKIDIGTLEFIYINKK